MAFTESYGYRGTVASGHPIVANILPGSWQPIAPRRSGMASCTWSAAAWPDPGRNYTAATA